MYIAIIIPADGVASLVDSVITELYSYGDADDCVDVESIDLHDVQLVSSRLLTKQLDPEHEYSDAELAPLTETNILYVIEQVLDYVEKNSLKLSRLRWIFTVPNDDEHLMLLFRKET